jgi:hypothetical protein
MKSLYLQKYACASFALCIHTLPFFPEAPTGSNYSHKHLRNFIGGLIPPFAAMLLKSETRRNGYSLLKT